MAIARKPKPKTIEEFIEEGGSAPAATETVEKKPTRTEKAEQPVKLRVPAELLEQIDAAVAARRPSPSRHNWILEAIYEKLARESYE
jgi:histidinol phosphatase-like enzyme